MSEREERGLGFAEYLIGQTTEPEELARVDRAVARRRAELGIVADPEEARERPVSEVSEYRSHDDGVLQAEMRAYRRKDGTTTERGPYWYFRYHQGGRQRKIYLGKTDDPEGALAEKREGTPEKEAS